MSAERPVLSNVEIALWNLGRANPPVTQAREQLSAASLDPARAEDVPESTAFRRAVDSLKEKDVLGRIWTRKADSLLCAQLDREHEEEGELRREQLGIYALRDGRPQIERGRALPELDAAYQHALDTYTGADVSRVLKAVLEKDGYGAYSLRPGVYVCPVNPTATDLLDRLERFASSLSVRFLRYQIPDTGAQRGEIADAIQASLAADLDAHAEAIAAYSSETKPGHLDNRADGITHTQEIISRLSHLIREHRDRLSARVDALRAALETVRLSVLSGQADREAQARVSGTRVIRRPFDPTAPQLFAVA